MFQLHRDYYKVQIIFDIYQSTSISAHPSQVKTLFYIKVTHMKYMPPYVSAPRVVIDISTNSKVSWIINLYGVIYLIYLPYPSHKWSNVSWRFSHVARPWCNADNSLCIYDTVFMWNMTFITLVLFNLREFNMTQRIHTYRGTLTYIDVKFKPSPEWSIVSQKFLKSSIR